jgi:hypothetical protein
MDNFDLWTKQNINDIIFNFNEKNYELLRSFIKWYDIESNYMYILSTRYFYSNECMELLLSTINAFIDVKNNDISEEVDVNELEKKNDISEEVDVNELEKKNDISEEVDVNELEKKNDITEEVDVNVLEKKNDSDEYVINDDYYFKENIVKNEVGEEVDDDVDEVGEEYREEVDDNVVEDEEEVGEDLDEDGEEVGEEVVDDVGEEEDGEDNNNLIINKFSNNEIILLLNILEEDTKKFSKHNYIIGKCKEELFFYNNFYLGFTTGIFVFYLLKFL